MEKEREVEDEKGVRGRKKMRKEDYLQRTTSKSAVSIFAVVFDPTQSIYSIHHPCDAMIDCPVRALVLNPARK